MKVLDINKDYKVSGVWLDLIFKIRECYEKPTLVYKTSELTLEQLEMAKNLRYIPSGKEEIMTISFPTETLNFLVGKLVAEFEKGEWEEV